MDARQKIDMPPLPARCHVVGGHYPDHTDIVDGYSAEQLREFARVYGVNIIATHTAELAAREAEIARLLELLAGCRTVFALALDNGKGEQYASLETRRGSFIHCVKLMQDLDAALTKQPPKD